MKSALLLAAITPVALGVSLCDQYASYADQGYEYNNNEWGKDSGTGSGCTYIDSTTSGGVSWHTAWTWSGGDNNVKQYPYSGRQFSDKKIVSTIGSIPTSASWSYTGDSIRADVAYDVFTASDPNHNTYSGDYELMIWLAKIGGVQPIGSSTGTVNVGGQNWDLWVGYNGACKVFSFVASSGYETDFSGDVKEFFDHITSAQGFPASSQHLLTVQFGTEPFTGNGAQFNVNHWDANVN